MATHPPARSGDERRPFDQAVATFRADVAAAGAHMAIDGQARATYDRLIGRMARELAAQASAGRISWAAAAAEAQGVRNATLQVIRSRSTPIGRALAQHVKREGRTLNELVARKTVQLFGGGADFNRLSAAQKNRVYAAIVESAGRSNPRYTRTMRGVSAAGRGLLVLSIALAVYNVAVAQDRAAAVRREGALLGAGIAGGASGGALAGLACGPGAPVCVTMGAFVGGTLAAFGVSLAF